MAKLFKSYPFLFGMASFLFGLSLGWGLPMIIPSCPQNGVLIIIVGAVVSAPFFIWAWVSYRRTKAGIGRDIIIDPISRSIQDSGVYWCATLHVKSDSVGSNLEDVTASITFGQMKKTVQTVWINPGVNDSSRVILRKGSKWEIALAEEDGSKLRLYGHQADEELTGDGDITLELASGDVLVGRWKFPKAIVAGHMQQVTPIRLSISHKEVPNAKA
jgi:hypothetical protein